MKKKLLAFLLALSMAVPYAPAITYAASAEPGDAVEENEAQNEDGEAQTGEGEAQTGEGEAQTGEGEAQTGEGEAQTGEGEAQTGEGEDQTGEGEDQTDEGEEEAEVKYVTMNVPYDDFYAAYSLTDKAVWDVNGEGLDAVSTATESKFTSTDGLALGTYNDGTYILGVTLPVAVKAEDYANLDATLTTGDYAFTDLAEAPTVYSELTVKENGNYSFSALQAYTGDTTGLSVIESANGFTSAGYGDYQIDLEGVLTAGTLANGDSYKAIYGIVLHTDNGKALGMTALENMWFGTRVANVEVAWSIKEGQGLKRAHGSGDNFYQFSDLNGQKLTSVDVITAIGVITIPCDITMTQYYNGEEETTAAVKDSQTLTVSYPSVLEDAQVSVTYKAGRATTTLADKVTAENGEVALSAALNVLETTYTVTVYSSNYAPISTTVTYGKKNQGTGKVQKFTYWVTVNAERNEAGDITSIAFSDDTVIGDQNAAYAETAMEGMQEQIAAKGSITSVNDLDVVSGATLTSNAIKAAVAEMNGEEFDLTAANGSLVMGKNGELGLADSIKKAENFLKLSALEKDDEGNYITDGKSEAWMTLYDLYNQAVEMKAANDLKENYEEGLEEGLLEAKIDVAIAAVKAESGSGDRGGASQAGDTTNLQAAVDSAKALVEADYTADSWKTLQDEVSEAESLIATGKANQSALDTQQADLESAVQALVKKADAVITAADKSVLVSAKARTFSLGASVDSNAAMTYTSSNAKITVDANGKVTVAAYYVGKAVITISAAATDNYKAAVKTVTVSAVKANAVIYASNKTATVSSKVQKIKLGASVNSKGTLTYASNNKSITVDKYGTVTVAKKYAGTATITIKAAATAYCNAATKTITVAVYKTQSMTAKAAKTSLKVNKTKAQTVKITVKKSVGKVTYKSSNAKVTVSATGVVTIPKNFKGTVTITVTAAGNSTYKAAAKTITIKVK